jgi:hypothetical protein
MTWLFIFKIQASDRTCYPCSSTKVVREKTTLRICLYNYKISKLKCVVKKKYNEEHKQIIT